MRRLAALVTLPVVLLFPQARPAAQVTGADTVRILFVGDLMAHLPQTSAAYVAGDRKDPSSYDYDACFRYVSRSVRDADFAVINMESPVGAPPYSGYPLFSAPSSLPAAACKCGFDLFLQANNHICDRGAAGVESSLSFFEETGALHTGLWRSGEEAGPLYVRIHGLNVAFVNFSYSTNGLPVPKGYHVALLQDEEVRSMISRARGKADFVIVLPHWGEEYELSDNAVQRSWEKLFYECGADVVVGAHPHVVQPVVCYTPATGSGRSPGRISNITAYSLGNFLSNMTRPYSQIGMMFTLNLVITPRGKAEIIEPDVEYLWCARAGTLEDNYTVAPIRGLIGNPGLFRDRAEYDKMKQEWELLKKNLK